MPAWISELIAPQTLATLGVIVFLIWGMFKVLPALRRGFRFLGAVMGEPEGPGMPRRESLLERLSGLETKLETVRHEVEFNNGTSVKDAVIRTEDGVVDMHGTLLAHIVESQRTTDLAERTAGQVEALLRKDE